MTNLQEIKLMNESMILYLTKIGKSSKRNEIIRKILNDDTCFFKLTKNDAYMILEDIGIAKEKIDAMYSKLISSDSYYRLRELGKINDEDKEIKVRYKNYDHNDLFKSKKETPQPENNSMTTYKETLFHRIINKIKIFFDIKI